MEFNWFTLIPVVIGGLIGGSLSLLTYKLAASKSAVKEQEVRWDHLSLDINNLTNKLEQINMTTCNYSKDKADHEKKFSYYDSQVIIFKEDVKAMKEQLKELKSMTQTITMAYQEVMSSQKYLKDVNDNMVNYVNQIHAISIDIGMIKGFLQIGEN